VLQHLLRLRHSLGHLVVGAQLATESKSRKQCIHNLYKIRLQEPRYRRFKAWRGGERDASACMRRHQASDLAHVCFIGSARKQRPTLSASCRAALAATSPTSSSNAAVLWRRKLRLKADLKAVQHILVSSADATVAFNTGFERVYLHRPAVLPSSALTSPPRDLSSSAHTWL